MDPLVALLFSLKHYLDTVKREEATQRQKRAALTKLSEAYWAFIDSKEVL